MKSPSPKHALTVDFAALAIADEDFAKIYRANDAYVDFQDPQTVLQLTKSILKRDFELNIELPLDRLCPPVPVRYEYISWLQGLVDTTSDDYSASYDAQRNVIGIDIGVGASCIYPLLGCACRPSWRFGGTEIDSKSFDYATKNILLNNLQSRIRLRRTAPSDPLLGLAALGIKHADFVMCNPPFFTSRSDMLATHQTKQRSPSAVCTGDEVEMVTQGGDLGFVTRLIEESEKLRDQIQWYSSMLGKLASVHAVVAHLRQRKITNYAVTSLQAGNVTRRWVIAWSFGDLRPRNDIARGGMATKEVLPFPTDFTFALPPPSAESSVDTLNKTMENLDLNWTWDQEASSGLAFARENVWSRSARRRRKQQEEEDTQISSKGKRDSDEEMDDAATLGVRISIPSANIEVVVHWLKGIDCVLFESFCGMLKRSLQVKPSDG